MTTPSKNSSPLISVIIPTFNRSTTILRAVESVLFQTYSNIELIVVDDCSTDDTQNVLSKVSDPRLFYTKLSKNSGATVARNKGIELSHGDYIAFNDSDDEFAPTKLQTQLDHLLATSADVTLCKMECYFEDGTFSHTFPRAETKPGLISYKDLLRYNSSSTQLLFGKAQCFQKVLFDPKMPRMQDWDETLRLAQSYNIVYQDKSLVKTYLQKDSISCNPQKALVALDAIFEKHKAAFESDKTALSAFFLKKASFKAKAALPYSAELKKVAIYRPTAKNILRYLLHILHLYNLK